MPDAVASSVLRRAAVKVRAIHARHEASGGPWSLGLDGQALHSMAEPLARVFDGEATTQDEWPGSDNCPNYDVLALAHVILGA
jgi:hypothetical protein